MPQQGRLNGVCRWRAKMQQRAWVRLALAAAIQEGLPERTGLTMVLVKGSPLCLMVEMVRGGRIGLGPRQQRESF